ncbi:transposase [Parageobacillus genomosp. 1]
MRTKNGVTPYLLPPYFPNLNMVERIWGMVKRQCYC